MKRIIFGTIVLALLLSTPAWAVEITADLAREIIDANQNQGESGHAFVIESLDLMTPEELTQLKEMLKRDMSMPVGKIVENLSVERQLARRVVNHIDDRLGTLQYDQVLEGRFIDFKGVGRGVSYYTFETIEGELLPFDVFISVSSIEPDYEAPNVPFELVRIYLYDNYVRKYEIVENNQ